jgi:hypothetical protein
MLKRAADFGVRLDMKIQQIFSGPGKYLLLMTWWVFVFFAICLFSYPVTLYLTSYIPFFVAFALTLIFSLFLNLADGAFTFWRRMGYFGKFATLMGFYSSTVIAILVTCLILSSDGIISYFDGDRVGDFGWLYIPSIFFYGFAGIVLLIGLAAIKGRKERLSQKTAKRDVAKSRRVP